SNHGRPAPGPCHMTSPRGLRARPRRNRTPPRWPIADSAKSLVRVDQILRSRGLLAVDGDFLELQRPRERDFFRVRARERGPDLGRDPLSELLGGLEADLLQEGGEQPAADATGHAEGAVEL